MKEKQGAGSGLVPDLLSTAVGYLNFQVKVVY